jgi:hypothetical protein
MGRKKKVLAGSFTGYKYIIAFNNYENRERNDYCL